MSYWYNECMCVSGWHWASTSTEIVQDGQFHAMVSESHPCQYQGYHGSCEPADAAPEVQLAYAELVDAAANRDAIGALRAGQRVPHHLIVNHSRGVVLVKACALQGFTAALAIPRDDPEVLGLVAEIERQER